MKNKIFAIMLTLIGFYLLKVNEVSWGMWLLVFAVFALIYDRYVYFEKLVKSLLNHYLQERECIVVLDFGLNIEEIVKHPILSDMFEVLKTKQPKEVYKCAANENDLNKVKRLTKEEWNDLLIKNYRAKYKKDTYYTVKYNIMNGFIWEDGKSQFLNTISHYIFIPYTYIENAVEDGRRENILNGLSIRLIIVNGFVNVQVGHFEEKFTPYVVNDSESAGIYQIYATIATFPLIYFWEFNIPERNLNFVLKATDSYFVNNGKRKNQVRDWRYLMKVLKDYRYLVQTGLHSSKGRSLSAKFVKKRDEILRTQGMKGDIMFSFSANKYLTVSVMDNREEEDNREDWFSDYYEINIV